MGGVAYGIAEGVLLSALPAMIIWHAAASAQWSTAASWGAALLASLALIFVHHLGYWDYRNRQVIPVLIGCGLLTVAFLATAASSPRSSATPQCTSLGSTTASNFHPTFAPLFTLPSEEPPGDSKDPGTAQVVKRVCRRRLKRNP
jgi:hypothetical protein